MVFLIFSYFGIFTDGSLSWFYFFIDYMNDCCFLTLYSLNYFKQSYSMSPAVACIVFNWHLMRYVISFLN